MNLTYLEQFVLAYTFHKPEYLIRLSDEMFDYEPYLALFKIGKEIHSKTKGNYISRVEILSYVGDKWSDQLFTIHVLDGIYDLIENQLEAMPVKKKHLEFIGALSQLSNKVHETDILMTLSKASELVTQGKMAEAILEAKSLSLKSVKELPVTMDLIYDSVEKSTGVKSGINELDTKLGGWFRGNIITVEGDVGTYKTQASLWMTLQALKANPELKAIYFEKEMSTRDIGRRLMSEFTKITAKEVMDVNNSDKDEAQMLKKRIEYAFSSQPENRDVIERLTVLGTEYFDNAVDIYEYVESHGFDIVVIDYLTMLGEGGNRNDSGGKNENSGYFYYQKQMQLLKSMTLTCNTITIIISQLKLDWDKNKYIKIPATNDMEFGSHLKQYSAYIFTTFHPYAVDKLKPYVPESYYYLVNLKNRHGIKDLNISMKLDPETFSFRNPSMLEKKKMDEWLINYKKGKTYESYIKESTGDSNAPDRGSTELFK